MLEPRVPEEQVEEEEVECKICGKQAVNKDYCRLHEKALQNLAEKFEEWKRALDISWDDYLDQVAKNPLTGTKAKEVAEALLSKKP